MTVSHDSFPITLLGHDIQLTTIRLVRDKRSVLRKQNRDTNRNIKKVGVLPIRTVAKLSIATGHAMQIYNSRGQLRQL